MKKHALKKVLLVFFVLVMLFISIGTVSAAEFDDDGNIPDDAIIDDDVFLSGDNCRINGTINGMLLASCQSVVLNGKINGDAVLLAETIKVSDSAEIDGNLFFAAAEMLLEGQVNGSVFGVSAAFDVSRNAEIGRNMYYGGYALRLKEGAKIGTDVFAGVYQGELAGRVGRDLTIYAGAIRLDGLIGRNAKITVDDSEEGYRQDNWVPFMGWSKYLPPALPVGIRISDDARVMGNVTFSSAQNLSQEFEKIAGGEVLYDKSSLQRAEEYRYDPSKVKRELLPGFFVGTIVLRAIRSLIVSMIFGALLLWLLLKPFKNIVQQGFQKPLAAMGWGIVLLTAFFLALMVVPIAFIMIGILLAFLSLGGLVFFWFFTVGSALLLFFTAGFFWFFTLSKVVSAFALGRWLNQDVFKMKNANNWLHLLIGVIVLVTLSAIPLIGWLFAFVAILFGTGSGWLALTKKKVEVAE